MKTAILGWGSLLWDDRPQFDQHHGPWYYDGPMLRLEFSRISVRRKRALTLVLEEDLGAECQVAYTLSHRSKLRKAIEDLKIREAATDEQVGLYYPRSDEDSSEASDVPEAIRRWADQTDFDAVIWTGLPNNFLELSERKEAFSLSAAVAHVESLCDEGKSQAVEYIFRAPNFIRTPLRSELQELDWFAELWEKGR